MYFNIGGWIRDVTKEGDPIIVMSKTFGPIKRTEMLHSSGHFSQHASAKRFHARVSEGNAEAWCEQRSAPAYAYLSSQKSYCMNEQPLSKTTLDATGSRD